MKNLTYIVIGALVLSGWLAYVRSCNDAKRFGQTKEMVRAGADSVRYWRDLWNAEHATRQVIEGDRETLHLVYGRKMDSLSKRLHLKQKQLQDMTEVLVRAQGQVVTVPVPDERRDTVNGVEYVYRGHSFVWQDGYMKMDGYVDSAIAKVNYSIDVEVNVTKYWKRRWFLGRKRRYIDAYCDNPNVKIIGLTAIKVN